MNRLQHAAIPLTILALVGLTACDGSSDPMSTLAPANNLEFAEMQLLDFEDAVTAAGDATLEGMMAFPPHLSPGRHHRHGPHAGPPLRALDLEPEQQEAVLVAYEAYRECLRVPLEAFREANQEILQRAGMARREILEQLRNEEIEREEAMARLRELTRATHEAIRNNPASAALREATCDCRADLFDAIESVLNDEQLEAWDRWVTQHAGDCARF
jgi:Spy/CpxP family protein refolding chaperone